MANNPEHDEEDDDDASLNLGNDDREVERIIDEALKDASKPGSLKQIKSNQEVEYITNMLSEFLDCYIILGYDASGNSVEIHAAFNQQQADSLKTMIIEAANRIDS